MHSTTDSDRHITVPLASKWPVLQASAAPLPCRGCTVNCPDYPQCKGKPWRLAEAPGGNLMVKFGGLHR